jgi:hypothetical protein
MAAWQAGRSPVIANTYPHMLPEDTLVWTRFLRKYEGRVTEVWYDLHVGAELEVPTGSPDYLSKVSTGVTKKRIDVVAKVDGKIWVVEVKPYCNMVAIGQAQVYHDLFEREFGMAGMTQPVVVCGTYDSDMVAYCEKSGVVIVPVGQEL